MTAFFVLHKSTNRKQASPYKTVNNPMSICTVEVFQVTASLIPRLLPSSFYSELQTGNSPYKTLASPTLCLSKKWKSLVTGGLIQFQDNRSLLFSSPAYTEVQTGNRKQASPYKILASPTLCPPVTKKSSVTGGPIQFQDNVSQLFYSPAYRDAKTKQKKGGPPHPHPPKRLV